MSFNKTAAALVHILTASGVLCTLFALVAITDQDFRRAFFWLGLALFIDAVDGPLARLVDTKLHLPRFSGERLDLIIDYLNYVVLPAFIVVNGAIISGVPGLVAAGLILMTSLYHFSDTDSKTREGYFVGFPALWNVVIFYVLAFKLSETSSLAVVVVFSVLTFVPVLWLHPVRVIQHRRMTGLIGFIWCCAASSVIWNDFSIGLIEKIVLVGAAVCLAVPGLVRTFARDTS